VSRIVSSRTLSAWFLSVSLLALGMMALIVLNPASSSPFPTRQSELLGSMFISICVLGAIAGVRPSSYSTRSIWGPGLKKTTELPMNGIPQKGPKLEGHHRSCDPFAAHVIHLQGKTLCAGCTGLTAGAGIAIAGSILYFYIKIPLANATAVFWLGFIGVAIGLVQHLLYRALRVKIGLVRFAMNVIFVVASFLLFIAVDQLTGNAALGIYLLVIIIFWILTRISMSKSEHERICRTCEEMCDALQSKQWT